MRVRSLAGYWLLKMQDNQRTWTCTPSVQNSTQTTNNSCTVLPDELHAVRASREQTLWAVAKPEDSWRAGSHAVSAAVASQPAVAALSPPLNLPSMKTQ